jgi:diguanylate cyclase (GGDEF)-like protein
MRVPYILLGLRLVRPLGLFSLVYAGVALAGYWLGIEALYRPLPNGPATHPLTAVCICLLGAGLQGWRPRRTAAWPLAAYLMVLIIGLSRLFEVATGATFLMSITPSQAVVEAAHAAGKSLAMGTNTASLCSLIALALILNQRHRTRAAQLLGFLALTIPLVSLTGYAYGLDHFYGQMALSTVIAGMPLALATLLTSSHRDILRAVLSPWLGGRIARLQILFAYLVPFLIGFGLLANTSDNANELFGLFLILVCSFTTCLVAVSAVIQEQVDRRRRSAERRLLLAASRDPLTNLANRRLLLEQARLEWERSLREDTALSVLMVDIDHFKQLNDSYGHAAGDQVLQGVAERLVETLRSQDLVARFGGEEFVILLPNTNLAGARQLAEKLRLRFDQLPIQTLPGLSLNVTVSIGCAERRTCRSFLALLDQADSALYQAKNAGRNQVHTAAPVLVCVPA